MNKMIFHYDLRLGKDVLFKDLFEIKRKLRKNPLLANVYLITIAESTHSQLDIYHSKYLMQKYYQERIPHVVGIAKEHSDAIAIVEQLMQECVDKRGDANLKAYLIGD